MNQARKRTGTKKVLSMILVLVMLLSLLSMAAFTLPASEMGNSKNSYDYNIMFLDCGRKYYSVDSIEQIIDNASAAGFNYIQLAVGNDGLRFLLNDMSLTVKGTTYDSEAVKSAIHAGNEKYYNFTVDELTQSEMDTIIAYAQTKGMGVIPCVNTPGHMDAILSAANSLTGTTCSYSGSVRTIDVTNDTAVAFTKALLQKYITYFAGKGCQYFNMGADEYANDKYDSGSMGFGNLQSSGNYRYYVNYVNDVAKMIKDAQMTPMAFNDGIYFNNNTSSGTFDTDIIICYWSNGWSGYTPMPASELAGKGFKLINTNGSYYWVLGKTDAQCDAAKAGGFDKTAFPGGTVSNPVGSMFCIWADYPGAETEASVISKTAATIAAFGKALPQIGIKSTSGTALTLNSSTELTVPGNAEATWSVSPAGVIELQSSGNADDKSAITGTSVIAKAVGAGTAKVTATVDDKTTYTTTLTVTDPSTVDVTVAVNGTKTITVDGYYNGSYATEDTTIATASAVGTAAVDRTENEVTTIESGKQYLIVHKKSGLVLNDSTSGNGILLGEKANSSDQLWTITKYSSSSSNAYTIQGVAKNYITAIGRGSATLGTSNGYVQMAYNSNGYWNIYDTPYWTNYYLNQYGGASSTMAAGHTADGASDDGSQWQIYQVTPGTKATTTITFNGVSKGTTTVTIGNVKYTIIVSDKAPDDALTADTITLEHWITNARVAATSGATGDDRNVQNISKTTDGIQSEDGVAVETLAYVPGYWEKTAVHYWQAVRLDKDHLQTADSGSDQTDKGTTLTHIRYYGGAWQYETADGVWHYFLSTDQFVIYYLQKTEVTKEVDTFVKDWGFDTDKTTEDWSEGKGQVALTFAVVYPDGTVSPAEGSMYASSTTIFNYWDGRDIGIVAPKNNSDYNIAKITVTDGKRDSNSSSNVWYTTDTITWNKKTNVAGEKWYDETEVWNKSSGTTPMVNGKTSNITWSAKNTAKLVLIYLEPIEKETNLNVQYIDLNANNHVFHSYQVAMKYNQSDDVPTFTKDLKLGNTVIGDKGPWTSNVPDTPNYLPDDAYVTNSSGTKQTFRKDITTFPEINGIYASGLYKYMKADISEDGKTLRLYYDLKATGGKTFVVDFGLPVEIPFDDFGITNASSNVTVSFDATDTKKTERTGNYGVGKIDMTAQTVTYTLYKTLDAKAPIPVYVSDGTNTLMRSVNVIPATSVYYEDSFASFTNADKSNGVNKKTDNGYWTTDGKTVTDAKQALEALGDQKNVYGYDGAYTKCNTFSMGSATKVTVDANTANNGQWPTATFTFKGTGFDVISLTNSDAGAVVYTVTNMTTGESKSHFINNYYGYAYKDGQWVVTNKDETAPYQVPVIKVSGLAYDTYKVEISVVYGAAFDENKDNQYSFWLDAIRVYDPAGNTLNDEYARDGENAPNYVEVKKVILDTGALENAGAVGAVFIDGKGGNGVTAADYKNQGPNHEAYLAPNQAIAFQLIANGKPSSVQIGAKLANGTSAKLSITGANCDKANNGSLTLNTATDMYYELTDLNWTQVDGTYKSNVITLTNTSDDNDIVSLTNVKFIGATYSSALPSAKATEDEATVVTFAASAAMVDEAVSAVDGVLNPAPLVFAPSRFEASWGHAVRKGNTATLTVKTSEDVDSITVDDQAITTYDTKTERTGWGWWAKTVTYREFTYQVAAEETTDYTICAVNSAGVSSDPITATLTVRPSVRDWWHGIFDKWF